MAEKKQRFINKNARELRLLGEKGNKGALNELIIRGKKGDKCAMAEVVSIYEGLIHKYSTRFFINGYDVDDLKQIAISVIIESISKFDGDHGSEFIFFISINVKNKIVASKNLYCFKLLEIKTISFKFIINITL